MKASELKKVGISIDKIHEDIEFANKNGNYKIFYMHCTYISDRIKLQLIEEGFKVYKGMIHGDEATIIEW